MPMLKSYRFSIGKKTSFLRYGIPTSSTCTLHDVLAWPSVLCGRRETSKPPSTDRSMLVIWGEGSYALYHGFRFGALSEPSSLDIEGSCFIGIGSNLKNSATFEPSGPSSSTASSCSLGFSSSTRAYSSSRSYSSSAPLLYPSSKGFDVHSSVFMERVSHRFFCSPCARKNLHQFGVQCT
ncbi:hypothetical protein J1N35_007559 [Gossypium stocksii]|uniref:Uncharacterized protein n=1 Tax=Gossypium stocksii TaxID=47602 RepID=A0A9D4AFR8_9ROSI|nr:hypothetical protein J1N35_007559 [Gossypium stocksii]